MPRPAWCGCGGAKQVGSGRPLVVSAYVIRRESSSLLQASARQTGEVGDQGAKSISSRPGAKPCLVSSFIKASDHDLCGLWPGCLLVRAFLPSPNPATWLELDGHGIHLVRARKLAALLAAKPAPPPHSGSLLMYRLHSNKFLLCR